MPPKRKLNTSTSPNPKRRKTRDDSDFSTWTVVELRNELKNKGLSPSGSKEALINRLLGKEKAPAPRKRAAEPESSDSDEDVAEKKSTKTAQPVRARSARVKAQKEKESSDEEKSSEDDSSEDSKESEVTEARTSKSARVQANNKKKAQAPLWKQESSIVYLNPEGSNDSEKLAGFDMDSTLILTKSGKTFASNRADWKWFSEEVPKKLKELHDNGHKVVIFSNQKGIIGKKDKFGPLIGKIADMSEDCGVPICYLLATDDDCNRKPGVGMFEFFEDKILKRKVDLANSIYVGDAAGRGEGWKPDKKKDFGCSDRKFAHNCGLKFYTPEEYFLNEDPAEFTWYGVDPSSIPEGKPSNIEKFTSSNQEVIMLVGLPASGKSTFTKTYLIPKGYVHVNRDTLKTQAKCLKAVQAALEEKKSVVIDNTNPSRKIRKTYIEVAEKAGVPVRCFYLTTPLELAKHLNEFREVLTKGESRHVPTIAYNKFKSDFEEPATDEGFTEVLKIDFLRAHPDDTHKELYCKWTERLR